MVQNLLIVILQIDTTQTCRQRSGRNEILTRSYDRIAKSSTFENASVPDSSRKAHFNEDLCDATKADKTDSNNCSSKSVDSSHSRLKQPHPSQNPLQASTHIFANPMTSVVVGGDDSSGQQTSTLATLSESSKQPTASFR